MLISLVEIYKTGMNSQTRKVYINPQSIIYIREDVQKTTLEEAKFLGFSEFSRFSTILINEGGSSKSIVVAHSPQEIHEKINSSRTLLKG
tara:strand:- start:7310 stop:7579 length:270 start_codon:yes stop_codon:yes gene_type:complete